MVPGVLITLGTTASGSYRFLLMPAMPLPQLKERQADVAAVHKLLKTEAWQDLTVEDLDKIVDLTYDTLRRNHPAITKQEFWTLLDINNASQILAAMFGYGTFIKPGPDETTGADGFVTYGDRPAGEEPRADGPLPVDPLLTRPFQF